MKFTNIYSIATTLLTLVLVCAISALQAQTEVETGYEDDPIFIEWYPDGTGPYGNDIEADDQIEVVAYPSPANGENIEVNYKNLPTTSELTLYDSSGKSLYATKVGNERNPSGTLSIAIGHLAAGYYLIKLVSGNLEIAKKILIQ